MPKKTYDNLPKDKKERIFNAGVLEFSYHSINNASVNTITRIANISKGSFYQYFEDKNDFYWFIVMEIIYGKIDKYERMLKNNDGDFFKTEEELFYSLLDLFDDNKYRSLISNVFKSSYMEFQAKLTSKASTIYFDMYDLLVSYGFKGYNIKTKDDFLLIFEMVRNIANNTIMTMINDNLGKSSTKDLYLRKLETLSTGIKKRGWF